MGRHPGIVAEISDGSGESRAGIKERSRMLAHVCDCGSICA